VHGTFRPDTSAVTEARHLIAGSLEAWQLGALVPTAELAVSELVANAVRHGRGGVEVRVFASATKVRIEVRDRGGGRPSIREPHRAGPDVGGWGLRLVDQLADDWGTRVRPDDTLVWAELSAPPPDDGSTATGS